MKDDEHRFNTAEIDTAKHRSPPEHRHSKPYKLFGRHALGVASRIIIILILCVAVTLIWFNRYNLTPNNVAAWVQNRVVGLETGDGYPYPIKDMSISGQNFLSSGKNAVFLSDTSLVVLNSTAKELVNRQHSFSNPVIKANNTHMLIYNLGGISCRVETIGKTVRDFTVDGKIISGALSHSGRYALITSSDGYCGKLTVYTSDGKVKSYYWFSDYYPTSVALNPDGTKAAVSGISSKNGALISAVYILNLNSSKVSSPAAVFSENMLFSVSWDNSSVIVAIGDKAAEIINSGSMEKHSFDFGSSYLTSYSTDSGRTALGLSSYENQSNDKFIILGKNGNTIMSKNFKQPIESVSFYGQSAAALSGGKIYFYSAASAVLNGTANAGSDAKAVALRDENSAYVLGVSEIRFASCR